MAIRPIFEQRKEDEAHAARQIITQRESESEEKLGAAVQRDIQDRHTPEKASAHEITGDQQTEDGLQDGNTQEFTKITVASPRSASAHRRRPGSGTHSEQPLRITTPESADTESSKPVLVDNASTETGSAYELNEHCGERDDPVPATLNSIENATIAVTETSNSQKLPRSPDEPALVQPLLPGRYYEPFLAIDRGKLSTRTKSVERPTLVTSVVPPRRPQSVEERAHPNQVLFKVLWKDLRVFQDGCEMMLSVLLSSEAEAHIVVASPSRDGVTTNSPPTQTANIQITEAHIALSRKLRSDLRVLTPVWAKWVLSHVQRDANGGCYLQLETEDALESSHCFTDDSVVIDGRQLHVDMNAICGTSLLVTISDTITGNKTTVFLSSSEIVQLAASLEIAPKSEGADCGDSISAELIKDPAFLSQIVSKSTVVRLGMKPSGLNTTRLGGPDFSFAIGNDQSPLIDTDDEADLDPGPSASRLEPSAFSPEVFALLLKNNTLAAIAFLSQVYVEDGMISALRHLQRAEAVKLHIDSYMTHQIATSNEAEFSDLISAKVEAAKHAKLTVRLDS